MSAPSSTATKLTGLACSNESLRSNLLRHIPIKESRRLAVRPTGDQNTFAVTIFNGESPTELQLVLTAEADSNTKLTVEMICQGIAGGHFEVREGKVVIRDTAPTSKAQYDLIWAAIFKKLATLC